MTTLTEIREAIEKVQPYYSPWSILIGRGGRV